MNGLKNPFAPKSRGIPGRTAQIKAWVRERFDLADDIVISVAELACREEECPDIETVIGVMRPGQAIETFRVHKPVSEVDRDDIALLMPVADRPRD